MCKKWFSIVFVLIIFSTYGQNLKKNSITFNSSVGLANSKISNVENKVDSLMSTKSTICYSVGLDYSRRYDRLEIGLMLVANVFKDRHHSGLGILVDENGNDLSGSIDLSNSYSSIQLSQNLSFFWMNCEKVNFYSSLQFGINHVFRDVKRVEMDFNSTIPDIDTNYVNDNLKNMRPLNFSARIATGGMVQLSENFYLKSELYYESKLYSIFKDSPSDNNKAWTRFYNFGVNFGLKYYF